ncbi:MAG TPA: hypothetical protein DG753_09090 [Clostridium sp.]|nr:hypothetical protein [Clostridium sp.]
MNPMEKFVQHILARLRMLEINNCIDLKSTKLNRNILIEKCEVGFNVYENGVNTKTFKKVPFQELSPLLKVLIKMEFSADPKIKVSTLKSKDENPEEKTEAPASNDAEENSEE